VERRYSGRMKKPPKAPKPPASEEKKGEKEKPREPKQPGLLPNEERVDMGDLEPKRPKQ
jgi:hypothetical protein